MAASGEEITVCFKVNTGKKFDLKLSPTLTVLEAKKKAETESEVPPAQQRLIYRGTGVTRIVISKQPFYMRGSSQNYRSILQVEY